ncbi:MAG: ATP-binding protein [Bacteroidales bacterium]|nr:ATP-binding protein [Bacteroidales bacterium]MBD5223688.1 ATP-binding protein [Bacteroidales bacterium]
MNIDYLLYQPISQPCSEHGKGIAYQSMMKRQIRKHSYYLQPMFEAFSNALESQGVTEIEVAIACNKTLAKDVHDFYSLHITDNGIGFNDENFLRFVTLFDDSKGYNNFGTGRIQFLHYFKNTQIRSVYIKDEQKHLRTIVLSNEFYSIYRTSILTSDVIVPDDTEVQTTISFFYVNSEIDKTNFQKLTTEIIRHELLTHYLSKFCLNRNDMPVININKYVNEVIDSSASLSIISDDIPHPEFQKDFEISYSTISDDGKSVIPVTGKKEVFTIQTFALPNDVISKNDVRLTSKGESVESSKFDFNLVREAPRLGDQTYLLFLISSPYLTDHDQDERGKLRLQTKKEFLANHGLFTEPEIVIDDIQCRVMDRIIDRYPLVKEAKEQYDLDLENMADMFSFDIDEIKQLGIKVGESPESILRRYHEYNGAIAAKKEAKVKTLYDSLDELTPGDKNFTRNFNSKVKSLTSLLPELVRANLSGYIARRKLVLLIFKKAIEKQLLCQQQIKLKSSKSQKKAIIQHEKFLHNIFFSQHSTDPKESNLWLLSDEFIHFSGVSEKRLADVTFNGDKVLREDLTNEELENLKHFEHNDITSRPDILLFPEEHKCVIIEFKSPDVELQNQVEQIASYASILREYTKPQYEITSFYAYMIGEKIDFEAFRRRNPEFKESYYFKYLFNPNKPVYGGKRTDGNMYIEILQFSTLLERATSRNKVFLDHID